MPKLTPFQMAILRMAGKHSGGLYSPGGAWSTPWERANALRGAEKLATLGFLSRTLMGDFEITQTGRQAIL